MNSLVRSHRRATAVLGTLAMGAALALTTTQTSTAETSATPAANKQAAQAQASMYATGTVKSSSGKKLQVSVSAYTYDTASFSISLSASGEYHSWSFQAPKSAVKINAKGGGSVKLTSKQTGGLGSMKLKLKPTGKFKSYKCAGNVHTKTRKLKITGPLKFNTKTKAWGKVGKSSKSFPFNKTRQATWSYDVDCPTPEYKNPCMTSLNWSAYKTSPSSYIGISGSKVGKRSTVYASRSVMLKKPTGAHRYDSVTKKAKAPVLTVLPDKNAKIKVYGTKGTATGKSSAPTAPYTTTCDSGTQHRSPWYGSYSNGKPALIVKAQAFGNFKLPKGTPIQFQRNWRTN